MKSTAQYYRICDGDLDLRSREVEGQCSAELVDDPYGRYDNRTQWQFPPIASSAVQQDVLP